MKIVIKLLIIVLFLQACSVKSIVVNKSKIEYNSNNILNYIDGFYNSLLKKDIETMWNLEAPHFRYINDFNVYKGYVNSFSKKDFNITINYIKSENNIFNVGISKTDIDGTYSFVDKWIKVDNKFYHLTENFLVFKK